MRPIDADVLKQDLTRFYDGEVTAKELIDTQPTVGGWISVKDRMPDPHGKNDHEADVMLYVPKREGVRQHGIYLGFLRKEPLPPDNGSGNFWGVKCPGSDWTVWDWSHFEEPIVTHWMPLPALPEEVNDDA